MKHTFKLPDFPNATFEMESSPWTGKSSLLMNSKPIEQLKEKGKPFLIPLTDGGHVKAYPKPTLPDFVPSLVINGVKNDIVEKLKWYQYAIGGLPILLIFMGGILGGAIGALAAITNFGILRQEGNDMVKYGKVIAISVAAYFVFAYASSMFLQMIN